MSTNRLLVVFVMGSAKNKNRQNVLIAWEWPMSLEMKRRRRRIHQPSNISSCNRYSIHICPNSTYRFVVNKPLYRRIWMRSSRRTVDVQCIAYLIFCLLASYDWSLFWQICKCIAYGKKWIDNFTQYDDSSIADVSGHISIFAFALRSAMHVRQAFKCLCCECIMHRWWQEININKKK